MRIPLFAASALALALLIVAAPAPAELTPGQKQAVDVLVKQLGDKEMSVRQKAVERLIELGPDVVPAVRKALAETTDAELKYRGELVLKGIMEKYGVNVEEGGEAVPGKVNFDASRITIDADAPLAEILAQFAKQSGNAPVALPPNWPADKVKFSVKDLPYWQALDAFSRAAKLVADVEAKTGAIALHPLIAQTPEVMAYAGPAKVTLAAAQSHRFFNEPAAAFTYQFTWLYEDRLTVSASDLSLLKVTAADGTLLEVEEKRPGAGTELVVGAGAPPRGQARLRLVNVPEKLVAPLQMTGVVKLTLGVGERVVNLGNLLKEAVEVAGRDGLTLSVQKVDVQKGDGAQDYVQVTLSAMRDAMPAPLPYGAPNGRFGFFLVDQKGKRYPGLVFPQNFKLKPHHLELLMKQDGTMSMSFGGKQGDGYNVYFLKIPPNEPVLTLVYVFPATVVTKEYAFKMENVPLP